MKLIFGVNAAGGSEAGGDIDGEFSHRGALKNAALSQAFLREALSNMDS